MTTIEDRHRPMEALSDADWQGRIEEIGEEAGYFEPLGASHCALFADAGPVLLVTFETRAQIRRRNEDHLPSGFTLAQAEGHSSLTLIADRETWFRDPAVYAYFDRLVDEAFFADFDRVVFYGSGPCGYAAAAFSVAAPGAIVIAAQPQATLEARLAGWDDRFRFMRRTSFTDRYGFAPDMIDGAEAAYILYDPHVALDAMHAALYARPNVTLLPCPHAGRAVERMFIEMGILEPMLRAACAGQFDAARFWRLYRGRRDTPRYLRTLLARLAEADRPYLEALACRTMVTRINGPRFRARLSQLEEELDAREITLPPMRAEPREG